MPDLPSGTVTFLFTDIEGSTALWEAERDAMRRTVERHLDLLLVAIEAQGGVRFKIVGDAVQGAFPTAPAAVAAALAAQRALLAETWPETIGRLRVRMALHTAAAEPRDGDYLTPGLNRLARLLAATHGGQVLLTLAAQDLARDALPRGASLRDLGEHPLRDLYRPERVFQLVHPDLPAQFPTIRTLATRPNNLPLQPTPFLGREDQVARIVELVRRDDVRLLTITGPGGVGKTRLALQAAADLLDDFADGVWFVDLSPLTDPDLVAGAILSALGARTEGGTPAERIAGILARKNLLLVLDNFERVVEAASLVGDLLAQAPGLKVLATSRIPLHAYGEREYPLAPLPLPDPRHLPPVAQLNQYDAVRLFVERAQAVRPDFTVTNENAPAVAEICHRLDGLPLAIELAAAAVKMLPPPALLKRLERRLPLLTGGARTLPARQQTMRATIAWSHDLLSAEEQQLFRRLAVFAGGFTLEAVTAVAGPDGVLDAFAGAASLLDKSLLRQEEVDGAEPRFRMLETVREYGAERLEESGEVAEAHARHATYFGALAERAAVGMGGPDELSWLLALETEHGNLRAALEWLLESGSGATLELASRLGNIWHGTSRFTEGRHWLERALALPHSRQPSSARLTALNWAGMFAHYQGDSDQARIRLDEALAEAHALGAGSHLAFVMLNLGIVAADEGDHVRAAELLDGAAEQIRESGDRYWLSDALAHRCIVSYGQGQFEHAETQCGEGFRLAQATGNVTAGFMASLMLGHIATERGHVASAANWYRIPLANLEAFGGFAAAWERWDTQGQARLLPGVALLAEEQGLMLSAARLFGMAETARALIGLVPTLPESAVYDRVAGIVRERIGEAAFADAFQAGRMASGVEALAEIEAVLAASDPPARNGEKDSDPA